MNKAERESERERERKLERYIVGGCTGTRRREHIRGCGHSPIL